MSDFNNTELRKLDLSLLLIFLALVRHRKAARVATELNLTPSAISHALQRLREVFHDPLFLRRPHGLEPTAVALALDAPIRAAVETLNHALMGPEIFAPARSRAILRVTSYDSELSTLLPGLIARLQVDAPGMRLIARALGRREALASLTDGTSDLALGFFPNLPDDFIGEALYEEDFSIVARPDHPFLHGPMTLKAFVTARHLIVSPGGDLQGAVDDALALHGLQREVVVAAPLFLPGLAIVAEAGLIAAVPTRLANAFAARFGLEVRPPPLAVRRFTITAVRHRRDGRNGLIDWALTLLRHSAGLTHPLSGT
jgi:DNA-binding transcriptional LysR family regulator